MPETTPKPCPFCGGPATVAVDDASRTASAGCRSCGVHRFGWHNPRRADWFGGGRDEAVARAVAAWDRRAGGPALCPTCERLAGTIRELTGDGEARESGREEGRCLSEPSNPACSAPRGIANRAGC